MNRYKGVQKITTDQAVNAGLWRVNLPVFIVMFGAGIGIFIAARDGHAAEWLKWGGLAIGFMLGWLTWSILITKWKVWAFSRVDNVKELKRKAVARNLLWAEGSFFERTEIRTAKERQLLKELDVELPDRGETAVAIDDGSIPDEVLVRYSVSYNVFEMLLGLGAVYYGGKILLQHDSTLLGIALVIGGLFFTGKQLMQIMNRKPQIKLDAHGITTPHTGAVAWSKIHRAEAERERRGKSDYCCLRFSYMNNKSLIPIEIDLDDLDYGPEFLNDCIRVFRKRHKQQFVKKNTK